MLVLARPRATLSLVLRISGVAAALACAEPSARAQAALSEAGTQPPGRQSVASRSRVVLRVSGELGAPEQTALVTLLRTELSHSAVSLTLDASDSHPLAWVGAVARDSRVLLIAWLDARDTERWRLYLVDAARDRAVLRPLPGGLRRDAAALEAIASIIVSAVNALQDGLEVASEPLANVVAPEPYPQPKAESVRPRRQSPARSESQQPTRAVALHASAAVAVASFERSAPVTAGASVSAGCTMYSRVGLRLALARHLPADIETPFGRFEVDRTLGRISAGWVLPMGRLALEPEAAVVAEHLSRSEAAPAAGALARDDKSLWHLGAGLGWRMRYGLSHRFAVEWTLASAYFPERIRYAVTTPDEATLAAPWAVAAETALGVVVSVP